MTYNVWSREDIVVYRRMQAIGRIVKQQSPDVIFFQEVTPYIHKIFQSFDWWEDYHCSPVSPKELATKHHFCLMLSKVPLENFARWKFTTTSTGQGYLEADINPDPATLKPIRIATTQLKCPSPPAPMHCMERYMQAEHAVAALGSSENVVFGGDMSWDDNTDLPFPLRAGWVDPWTNITPKLKAPYYDGNTRHGHWIDRFSAGDDRFSHFSVGGLCIAPMKRSDRFACKLQDYAVKSIELVGTGGEPGAGVHGCLLDRKDLVEFRPSCHYGVVLTIVPGSETPLMEEEEGLLIEDLLYSFGSRLSVEVLETKY